MFIQMLNLIWKLFLCLSSYHSTRVFTGLDRFIVIVKWFTAFWKERKWRCQTEQESLHVWAKALVSLVVNMNVYLSDKCCFESQQTEQLSGFLSQQSLWLLMPIRNKFNTHIHTGQCLFLDVFRGVKYQRNFTSQVLHCKTLRSNVWGQ